MGEQAREHGTRAGDRGSHVRGADGSLIGAAALQSSPPPKAHPVGRFPKQDLSRSPRYRSASVNETGQGDGTQPVGTAARLAPHMPIDIGSGRSRAGFLWSGTASVSPEQADACNLLAALLGVCCRSVLFPRSRRRTLAVLQGWPAAAMRVCANAPSLHCSQPWSFNTTAAVAGGDQRRPLPSAVPAWPPLSTTHLTDLPARARLFCAGVYFTNALAGAPHGPRGDFGAGRVCAGPP